MDIYGNIMQTACTLAGEDVSHDYPHTVTGALDALADVLADDDVDAGHTIAEAVAAVGDYIGGGGGGQATPMNIAFPQSFSTPISSIVWRNGTDTGTPDVSEPVDVPQFNSKIVTVTAPSGVVVEMVLASGLGYDDAAYSHDGTPGIGYPATCADNNGVWKVWYTQPCLVDQVQYTPVVFLSEM